MVFTNASSGCYSVNLWKFGDGTTSWLETPIHTYTAARVFSVALTVSGVGGDATETKVDYISVAASTSAPTTG